MLELPISAKQTDLSDSHPEKPSSGMIADTSGASTIWWTTRVRDYVDKQ